MKLRNKKTGEIKEYTHTMTSYHVPIKGGYEIFTPWKPEEWEELEDVEEPLIKDERIRRAVRAWVEIGKYERVYYDRAYNRLADDHDFVHCIEFAIDPCPEAESGRCYTLTELCGEEEKEEEVEEDLRDEEY